MIKKIIFLTFCTVITLNSNLFAATKFEQQLNATFIQISKNIRILSANIENVRDNLNILAPNNLGLAYQKLIQELASIDYMFNQANRFIARLPNYNLSRRIQRYIQEILYIFKGLYRSLRYQIQDLEKEIIKNQIEIEQDGLIIKKEREKIPTPEIPDVRNIKTDPEIKEGFKLSEFDYKTSHVLPAAPEIVDGVKTDYALLAKRLDTGKWQDFGESRYFQDDYPAVSAARLFRRFTNMNIYDLEQVIQMLESPTFTKNIIVNKAMASVTYFTLFNFSDMDLLVKNFYKIKSKRQLLISEFALVPILKLQNAIANANLVDGEYTAKLNGYILDPNHDISEFKNFIKEKLELSSDFIARLRPSALRLPYQKGIGERITLNGKFISNDPRVIVGEEDPRIKVYSEIQTENA